MKYSKVFDRFLRKIVDDQLYNMVDEDRDEQLVGYMDSAIAHMNGENLRLVHDYTKRDNKTMEFEEELTDFEQEAISNYMVYFWYDAKVNSLEHILLFIGTKDERFTPQKEHMNMLMAKQKQQLEQARKFVRNNHTLKNSFLEN